MKQQKRGRHQLTGPHQEEAPHPQKYRIEIRPAAAEFISALTGKDLRLVIEAQWDLERHVGPLGPGGGRPAPTPIAPQIFFCLRERIGHERHGGQVPPHGFRIHFVEGVGARVMVEEIPLGIL